jgi:hypothetical protein
MEKIERQAYIYYGNTLLFKVMAKTLCQALRKMNKNALYKKYEVLNDGMLEAVWEEKD